MRSFTIGTSVKPLPLHPYALPRVDRRVLGMHGCSSYLFFISCSSPSSFTYAVVYIQIYTLNGIPHFIAPICDSRKNKPPPSMNPNLREESDGVKRTTCTQMARTRYEFQMTMGTPNRRLRQDKKQDHSFPSVPQLLLYCKGLGET